MTRFALALTKLPLIKSLLSDDIDSKVRGENCFE